MHGSFSGNINDVNFRNLLLDIIALTKDGRVYVVIRRPPPALAHNLKIFTPFADAAGWMHAVRKVKGVPNGFSVVGSRLTRSVLVSFDTGNLVLARENYIIFSWL